MELKQRNNLNDILLSLQSKRWSIIIGPRRTGKTSILKLVQKEYSGIKNIFIDIESLDDMTILGNYRMFTNYLRLNGFEKNTRGLILLDEVQHIENISSIIKTLIDNYSKIMVIMSGSSSIGILKNIKQSGAGRKRVFNIPPLEFDEFLNFIGMNKLLKKLKKVKNSNDFELLANEIYNYFYEYQVFGGMPEVALIKSIDEKITELNEITKSYILYDIRQYIKKRINIVNFNKFIRLIALNSGYLFQISKFSQECSIKRREVEELIYVLEAGGVISLLEPFFRNKKKSIVKSKKVMIYDPGIRNALIRDFREMDSRNDVGFVNEILVYNHIKNIRNIDIQFYRTKNGSEIDFIVNTNREIIPIEVKSGSKNSIPKAMIGFIKENDIKKAIVVNRNIYEKKTYFGASVYFIPLPVFLSRAREIIK